MADRYIWSGAGGTANGANWTNAHLTLNAACSASTAGDRFFVAHDHDESTASAVNLAFKGSNSAPDDVMAVDRAGSVPPVAADLVTTPSAKIKTTGASALSVGNGARFWGIEFLPGFGGSGVAPFNPGNQTGRKCIYQNCKFTFNTGLTSVFQRPSGASTLDLIDCTISFGHANQFISGANGMNPMRWVNNPSIAAFAGTIPTVLFGTNAADGRTTLEGIDLSGFGSGKTLVATNDRGAKITFINCKLDSAVTVAGNSSQPGNFVEVIGCDSGSNILRNEKYTQGCTLLTETTIKRTAGAEANSVGYCWKLVSTSTMRRIYPFETFEGALWNNDTGSSKTLVIHVLTDNVTLTDNEIWLEVDYLNDASYPLSTRLNDGVATPLTTASNQTSDSGEAWTTTGLTTPVKQKLEVTFTPAMAGPIRWRVKYAKASSTAYVCPKPDLI